MFGNTKLCTLPLSSLIFHFTVPTMVELVIPLYPLILTSDLTGGDMKSAKSFVRVWLQQLSIRMSYESVSKLSLGLFLHSTAGLASIM